MDRRTLLKTASAAALLPTGAALGAPAPQGRPVKLGLVAPLTGALAAFAEPDPFVLKTVRERWAGGITIAGKVHPVQIIERDSQSSTSRAAEVANDLILQDKVDLMLVANTADTVNPVSDQCEANEVPCISTDAPWQPVYFGRGGTPAKGFDWTYHFFWGMDDIIAVFIDHWNALATNKVIGGLWSNDIEGNSISDAKTGFPPALAKAGFKLVDPGRFPPGARDFSAQIAKFKAAKVEILTGVMTPPDFTTFWQQAAQQGLKPKIATFGKALLFPSAIEALGKAGQDLSCEVWWSPNHPFTSSLIPGMKASDLAARYMAASKKQWTQPLGFKFALFEVAGNVLSRCTNIDDPKAIAASLRATNMQTIVGPVRFSGQPVKNVTVTPLVGGQWRKGAQYPYDLVIVNNARAPQIPMAGKLEYLPV